jgi:hypothetical protein
MRDFYLLLIMVGTSCLHVGADTCEVEFLLLDDSGAPPPILILPSQTHKFYTRPSADPSPECGFCFSGGWLVISMCLLWLGRPPRHNKSTICLARAPTPVPTSSIHDADSADTSGAIGPASVSLLRQPLADLAQSVAMHSGKVTVFRGAANALLLPPWLSPTAPLLTRHRLPDMRPPLPPSLNPCPHVRPFLLPMPAECCPCQGGLHGRAMGSSTSSACGTTRHLVPTALHTLQSSPPWLHSPLCP